MNPVKLLNIFRLLKNLDIKNIFAEKAINFEKLLEVMTDEQQSKIINDICNIIKDTKDFDYVNDVFFVMDVLSAFFLDLLKNLEKSQDFTTVITALTGVNLMVILQRCQSMTKSYESSTESEK